VRYDRAGVSRVGAFLWGLGDPPGVNWDLGNPPRGVPELPPAARRESPPRLDPSRAPDPLSPRRRTEARTSGLP
jgi:hypothetical protein